MSQVVDCASAVDPAAVKAAGFAGMIRYVSDYPAKNITPTEYSNISTQGLQVALVCEQGNQPAMRGRTGGLHDSGIANAQADALGHPQSATIYYVAEDPTPLSQSAWPTVVAYFQALSGRPRGAYGGGPLVSHLLALGLVTKTWNVSTWGPTTYPPNLTQLVGANTHGLSVDVDQVWTVDYGQAPRPYVPVPTPTPIPPEVFMSDGPTVIENGNSRHVFVYNPTANVVYHWVQAINGQPNWDWQPEKLEPPA